MNNDKIIKIIIILAGFPILYHFLVLSSIVPYQYAWGGRLESFTQVVFFETISILVALFFIFTILIKGKIIKLYFHQGIVDVILWIFVAVFSINTIGNLFAKKSLEMVVFTPMTFITVLLLLRILLKKKSIQFVVLKAAGIIGYSVTAIIVFLTLISLFVWWNSPGQAQMITDDKGRYLEESISVIEKITLGKQEQYLIIRGANRNNPVMLFLHGGPGSPEFSFIRRKNSGLEKKFVMVYWEQRGSGKSFNNDIPLESMNIDQFVADTKELSEHLKTRFNKRKIFVMAHSWGTIFGILTVEKYPDLFHAYFGIGQASYQYEGKQLSLKWLKRKAMESGKKRTINAIDKLHIPEPGSTNNEWLEYMLTERRYLEQFSGGITHKGVTLLTILHMLLTTKEYTIPDKINYVKGALFSLKTLAGISMETNLFTTVQSLQIPVYIFHGAYDYQVSYSLSKKFFNQLEAPQKGFFTFQNAAHNPNLEEPEEFNSIINNIVQKYEFPQ